MRTTTIKGSAVQAAARLCSRAAWAAPILFASATAIAAPDTNRLWRDSEVLEARGLFTAAFSTSCQHVATAEMARRFRARLPEDAEPYSITGETFQVRIPASYSPSNDWGVLVYVDPGGRGDMPPAWAPVLERHRLLTIAPRNAGNERYFLSRIRLTLDAAFSMARNLPVVRSRLYVSGVSGGGRVASVVAPLYPDIFRGGYYMVGCDYFRPIPSAVQTNAYYRALFSEPNERLSRFQKETCRYVLLTGETDGNRDQTIGTYRHGYLKDGYQHVTYIEVPGMGHASPDADWFEKGLVALDGQASAGTNHPPATQEGAP